MLPVVVLSFASCDKEDRPNEDELPGDGIIRFEDENFLRALLEVQYFGELSMDIDTNSDGQISEKEASIEDLIYVDTSEIKSMDEIRYFTDLKYLFCQLNQLTALDVSNNTALEIFSCRGNQLTTLDLSNNTNLVSLRCDYNQLTTLDVSKNPDLENFYFTAVTINLLPLI